MTEATRPAASVDGLAEEPYDLAWPGRWSDSAAMAVAVAVAVAMAPRRCRPSGLLEAQAATSWPRAQPHVRQRRAGQGT